MPVMACEILLIKIDCLQCKETEIIKKRQNILLGLLLSVKTCLLPIKPLRAAEKPARKLRPGDSELL